MRAGLLPVTFVDNRRAFKRSPSVQQHTRLHQAVQVIFRVRLKQHHSIGILCGGVRIISVLRRPAGTQGSATGASPWGFPYTVDPGMIRTDFVAMAANTSLFMRVIQGGTISSIALVVATSVGNLSVGVYRNSGLGRSSVPGALLTSSGSVPCPASEYAEVAFNGSVDALPGDWLAIPTSSTASFRSALGSPTTNDLGKGRQMLANGHPLVTLPAGLAATIGFPIVLIGG